MSLGKILAKSRLNVLGLNSGTSADGLDLALMCIDARAKKRQIRFLCGARRKYPKALRGEILKLADSRIFSVDELVYLHNLVGKFAAQAARSFVEKLPSGTTVDLVASHGQTVRHLPQKVKYLGKKVQGTMQIGSADFISTATGLPVVSDFRQADIALGNEGAPITVAAMGEIFSSPAESRLIINIGGISNYFFIPRPRSGLPILASDCGPGNSLSDIISLRLHGEQYDRCGRRAQTGRISDELVSSVMSGGFFKSRRASTGRESFGARLADRIVKSGQKQGLANADLMATTAEITARSIARCAKSILRMDKSLSKLYLTGGGRYNIFIVDRLKHHLPSTELLQVDALGIDGDYVEAAAYAVMGEACLRSRAVPTRFAVGPGQKIWPVLGKITQPPGRV